MKKENLTYILTYTIHDATTRDAVRNFITENMKGTAINESTYQLNDADCPSKITEKIDDEIQKISKGQEFDNSDFINLYYAARYADPNDNTNKDKITEVRFL